MKNLSTIFLCMLFCTSSIAQKDKAKKWIFWGKKHHFVFHVDLGVKTVYVRSSGHQSMYSNSQEFYNDFMIDFGFSVNSLFYFKESEKRNRLALNIEYLRFGGSGFVFLSGYGLNVLNPGINYSHIFSKKTSGLDLSFNTGFTMSRAYTSTFLSSHDYDRMAYGLGFSPKISFWFRYFSFGLTYQYSLHFSNDFFHTHRYNLMLGFRL
ncbi:MAG: hypothetical protein KDC84_08420 [Crocinitomicaceae bacterium]|nr:hypothetical protein [Crocinitomicaceae bacterium]